MKIIGNEELIKYMNIINNLKDKFVFELNIVNNEYTPIFVKIKKEKSMQVYIMGIIIFGLVIVSFLSIFGGLSQGYYLYLTHGLLWLFLILSIRKLIKISRQYHSISNEWQGKHLSVCCLKEEANQYFDKAKEEAFRVMTLNIHYEDIEKAKETMNQSQYDSFFTKLIDQMKITVYEEIGKFATSEEVVKYYEEWGKKFTGDEVQNNQEFLENRKQKARLITKEPDEN